VDIENAEIKHQIVFEPDSFVEMDPRHADLGRVQDVIQRPQRRPSRIANARGAMARVAIGLSQDILKAFLECCIYIRVKRRKVASNGRFSHQVLQKATFA
jgi:hypothetical protein